MLPRIIVFAVLALALVLFLRGRWRYDVVALMALLVLTLSGIVPAAEAFTGFGHPAVITVAAILVVSRGLATSGAVDLISRHLGRPGSSVVVQVGLLTAAVTLCSAFMNNVGALALMMPVAVRIARQQKLSPSLLLMPLAFGSLLGGMTTLIGTPPNIIIGAYREEIAGEPFRMFDFSPVGVVVAIAGVAFIALAGWRLLPRREPASRAELFRIDDYTTELVVPAGWPLAGRSLEELRREIGPEFLVAAILHGGRKVLAPRGHSIVEAGDHLLVEVDPQNLPELLEATGLELEPVPPKPEALQSPEVPLLEAVVLPDSRMVGRTAASLRLRSRQGLNLVAVARQGARLSRRLSDIRFRPGDVLLLQAPEKDFHDTLGHLGCLPLAERELRLAGSRRMVLALGIFGAALATLVAGWLPAESAFVAAALAMVVTGLVTIEDAYRSIEWPVVVLLAAMIPVGGALETTGGAAAVASGLVALADFLPTAMILAAVLVLAMGLSDLMNNAATAVIMAPIAAQVAAALGVSADPFLMAVAVGASCAFLTPIGHQSNTLVMGPGGYRFGDYWRLGLPLELLILLLGVPMILWAWPP